MSTPYLGELRVFACNFAPKGWALCNGQLLAIQTNQALFALLGTTYGGDGRTTFALPDLRGRVPIHADATHPLGLPGGAAFHALTYAEYAHGHAVRGQNGPRTATAPANAVLASGDMYGAGPVTGALAAAAVGNAGGGQPHENRQPYLTLNVCIAREGIFPSRN